MFGCNTHLLKHIKQAILVWSFRQNIFLGCCPVFEAISAPDEFIVQLTLYVCPAHCIYTDGVFINVCPETLTILDHESHHPLKIYQSTVFFVQDLEKLNL